MRIASSAACGIAAVYLAGCTRGVPDPTEPPPPPELPVLVVDEPARGAFITDGEMRIAGHVEPGDGRITTFTLGDADVDLHNKDFDEDWATSAGLQVLSFRVEDDLDQRAVDGRAAQVGPVNAPGELIEDAIAVQLGPEMLDDDDPELDDLAAIAAVVAADPSTAQLLVGYTVPSDYYTLEVTGASVGSADADIVPVTNALQVTNWLYDVDTTFDADIIDWFTVSGSAHADSMELDLELAVRSDASGVHVVAVDSQAHLSGFTWEAEWVPGFVEDYLADDIRATMEEQLADEAAAQVGSLVEESLASFAVDTTFGERDEVHVQMSLSGASVSGDGLVITLDGAVEARIPVVDHPSNAGSLRTDRPGPSLPVQTDAPFAAVVDDDFLNQALFAFWEAGDLGGIEVSGDELTLMTGEPLPPPLGPAETVRIDTLLPAVVAAPTAERGLDLAIGEMQIRITREDGEEVAVSLNVRTPADLVQTDAGGLSMVLDDRPSAMYVAAGMLQTPEGLDPGDLASLFRLSAPNLLGKSSILFPEFPAPSLPLGDFVDAQALANVELGLTGADAKLDESGWLVLTGRLEPQ